MFCASERRAAGYRAVPQGGTPGVAAARAIRQGRHSAERLTAASAVLPGGGLTASQLSGTGSGQIALTASGAGFEPGVYRATVVIHSQNAQPQYINVPVMFVLGGSASGTAIAGIANAASFQSAVSPGMLLSVFGTQLANSTAIALGNALTFSTNGVSATVDGLEAPHTL